MDTFYKKIFKFSNKNQNPKFLYEKSEKKHQTYSDYKFSAENLFFGQNFHQKFHFFHKLFTFHQKFLFLTKSFIFDQNFYF